MADTQTQSNGVENGLEEEDLTKLRPADIDADVKEMERRKRVEMIMNSKLFREELERIIEMQMKDGNGPAGLLQQISDMMGIQAGKLHTTQMFRGSNCVTPINDIRGVESMAYAKGDKHLRCKMASVFRLMDLYGWSQGIHNQITVRLNQDEELFLVNPFGMLCNEITASSLVKVDMQGNVVEAGTTNFSVNTQGFLLHSSIHASRPDIKCIIHIHTPSVLAVSSLKCGLLPLCQEALVIGEVSQHPFVSGIFEPEEREKIIRNLGPRNKILLLNNHGALCCGETVEEAFYNVYNTVLASETQMKLMPVGVENLVLVNDETRKQVYDAAHRAPEAEGDKKVKHFRVGELEFEALIRMLDNAGFRTGYIYRHPLVKGDIPKPKNDVEVPPAVSSLGYLIEEEKLYKQGNWKKYVDGRNRLDRTKWLNSPNVYQKVEILETGTPDPKKITKWVDQNSEEWVAESSPTHSSTPVKIDSALQFVPKNTNPKEFKKLQQQLKQNRLADKITSGPQSHILEGVTWEEAKKLQDANITQTGDQVILVGAASKGIIQRNFQHNALVYKTPYAKNPFDSISDKEIEDYKRLIERKQRGDTDYEESQSESEAVSSRQDALRHIKSPLMSPQSATSETEEESRDEPRVLRIETKTAPQPIQAEVVLSDAEFDTTDTRVERSQSARYPKAEKPESVTIINSFRKSWSLKRDKEKSKDIHIPDVNMSRTLESSLVLTNYNTQTEEQWESSIARITNLKQKPVIFGLGTNLEGVMLKSASDPCNLANFSNEGDRTAAFEDYHPQSLDSDPHFDLKRRLSMRKKLIYSAKMRFLGMEDPQKYDRDSGGEVSPGSRIRSLISEIRDKINEVMSPQDMKAAGESNWPSLEWIPRRKFVDRSLSFRSEEVSSELTGCNEDDFDSNGFEYIKEDATVIFRDSRICEESERLQDQTAASQSRTEDQADDTQSFHLDLTEKNDVKEDDQVVETLLTELINQVVESDGITYTLARDSDADECSHAESTELECYYNVTVLKPENSQTILEIKQSEDEVGKIAKHSDTGIDTDFASEKRDAKSENDSCSVLRPSDKLNELENLTVNKSPDTDSSIIKSGRTSTDIDTSYAFKTETEYSEKLMETDSEDKEDIGDVQKVPQDSEKLPGIPESPEFVNVDTEDAPVTSSSKDSSPELGNDLQRESKSDPVEPIQNAEGDQKPSGKKKRRGKKSLTKITVKKGVLEKNSEEPVVSEIKLTIKNSGPFIGEKYEVEIQDEANTSEEMSKTSSSLGESFESYRIIEDKCDCPAQQNLETLQCEVNNTIEKLQSIESYFEEEIRRSSFDEKFLESNRTEEFSFKYMESEELAVKDAPLSIGDTGGVFSLDESVEGHPVGEVEPDLRHCSQNEVPEVSCNIEVSTEGVIPDDVNIIPELDANANIHSSFFIKIDDLLDFDKLLEQIITASETSKSKCSSNINDVFEFILNDEESPVDSLMEFEDMENVVSLSESIVSEVVDTVCSTEAEDETQRKKRRKKTQNTTFNVLIATPTRKEIYINYDERASSSFSVIPEGEIKCNSYINTDDVNEDFADSPEWFSPGKNSGNTSFDSAISNLDDHPPSPVCSCSEFNDGAANAKSSTSLTIIEEVEEAEMSTQP